jgi:hypothetical protein
VHGCIRVLCHGVVVVSWQSAVLLLMRHWEAVWRRWRRGAHAWRPHQPHNGWRVAWERASDVTWVAWMGLHAGRGTHWWRLVSSSVTKLRLVPGRHSRRRRVRRQATWGPIHSAVRPRRRRRVWVGWLLVRLHGWCRS